MDGVASVSVARPFGHVGISGIRDDECIAVGVAAYIGEFCV